MSLRRWNTASLDVKVFLDNERKGLIGMTLGFEVITLLALFGVFNLYYSRKY